jgi:asparagine synthase (glutamine-hydrolysing)
MCGICGIVGTGDHQVIERMTLAVSHRGPDDHGTAEFPVSRVALGHRRLSILDLSKDGHQPMADHEKRYWITYNGEVYNFLELRELLEKAGHRFRSRTDTEVVLNGFREWGTGLLDMINGMFAFAIWDEKEKTLFAARDKLGIKPFYYFQDGERFLFASEIKSIIASGLYAPEVDQESLITPTMYVVAPGTGFKGVRKLLPGHFLTVKDGRISVRQYWDLHPDESLKDYPKSLDDMDVLLREAVRGQMLADVPVGAFLSGGVDSSLIVAQMSRFTSRPIHTFTIKFDIQDQKFENMPDDSLYAREVAREFNCVHHEFVIRPDIADLLPKVVWHLDEPLADPAAINTFILSKMARDSGIFVLLNGMGGDEVFGGYRRQLACLYANLYRALVPDIADAAARHILDRIPAAGDRKGFRFSRWAKRFINFAGLDENKRFCASGVMNHRDFAHLFLEGHAFDFWESPYVRSQERYMKAPGLSYLTRMCLADTKTFMTDHNLNYFDKCTMAVGVESRPPLIDTKIVEYMFKVGPDLRIHRSRQKRLLKGVAARYLPPRIVDRPKAPFGSPLRSWMRGPLSGMLQDYLSPDRIRRGGIYRSAFLEEKIKNDRAGLEDNAHLLWMILSREVWLDTFFGQSSSYI